jgi:flavorubredoxin
VEADEVIDLGSHRMRFLPTPHVPHNWESGVWFDETTRTLFAGDVLTHVGDGPAVTADSVVDAAVAAEEMFQAMSGGPTLAPTLHRLADLEPTTLALMHGSSFTGDGAGELHGFADAYERSSVSITW